MVSQAAMGTSEFQFSTSLLLKTRGPLTVKVRVVGFLPRMVLAVGQIDNSLGCKHCGEHGEVKGLAAA